MCEDTGARLAGRRHLLTTSRLLKSYPRSPVALPARLLQKPGAPPEIRTRKDRFLRPARMPVPPAGR